MSWMAAAAILTFILLPLLLLSVPLTFQARGRFGTEDRSVQCEAAWTGGLVAASIAASGGKPSFTLRLAGLPIPVPHGKPGVGVKKKQREPRKQKHSGKRQGFPLTKTLALLNQSLLSVLLSYLRKLVRALNLHLELNGVYGTDDPALTGALAGLVAILPRGRLKLDLEPDFTGSVLDVSGTVRARIVPIVILWLTARLLLTGPVRRLWWPKVLKVFKKGQRIKEVAQHV
ncbi:hypothetical protein ACP3TJ_09205 [Desulforudis sp. 1088]|uniref:hypothetical protein n=1 Tax=unclassified Candidatus Desulforudis TaxID=2635950 RepID=UPI0034952CDF